MLQGMKKAWRGLRYAEIAAKSAALNKISKGAGKQYLIESLGSMPGLPSKVTQFLLMKSDDAQLKKAKVEAMSITQVRQLIEEGSPGLAAELLEIEEQGLVASLGQVHRGRLKDGSDVAIKVQFPKLEEEISIQIELLFKTVNFSPMKAFQLDVETYRKDFLERFSKELDYRIEAKNQIEFAQKFEGFEFVVVPRVLERLSSRTILVQSFEESMALDQIVGMDLNKKQDVAEVLLSTFFASVFYAKKIHVDPHPGNWGVRWGVDGIELVLYDFGAVLDITNDQASLLAGLVSALSEKKQVSPLEYFIALGFDLKKLIHIQRQLPSLSVSIFDPLLSTRPWDAKDWSVGEQIEKVLGADKWWFRTAGPPWFLFLMRAVHGLHSALCRLEVRCSPQEVYKHILDHCPEIDWGIVPAQVELSQSEIENMTKISDHASSLRVDVTENGDGVVNLELPVRLVDDLENLISEEVHSKINEMGINLSAIKEKAQKSGYVKQELFNTLAGSRKYHVWLE